jgi:alkylated DNA repair dioxygenase AlkB
MGHFRLDPAPASTPGAILEAARRVSDHLAIPFNSVGLNLYRDGRDSVAPHNDHLNEIRKGFPIALVSLGAVRRMTIRAKEEPRRVFNVDLEPGSLLVMDYSTQLHYTHAVPKTAAPVGERISLALRVKRPREQPAGDAEGGVYR